CRPIRRARSSRASHCSRSCSYSCPCSYSFPAPVLAHSEATEGAHPAVPGSAPPPALKHE
ncbi:hypothetical protein CPB97_006646, partial [Podila verticillata]